MRPNTPREDGFAMPAEWDRHQATLMAWPTRRALWGSHFDEAKTDYAEVARAIAAFEPLVMVCCPGDAREVRDRCGAGVEPVEMPIDDSWVRDNGPIFVRDARGEVALVHFRFNAWGEKFHPYGMDAELPMHVAAYLGCRRYEAPIVLEGGAFFVDGEGTLLTTEECLLNPNRNPGLAREQIEDVLRGFLGVETVVWLPFGMAEDRDTDGHVDGVAQYIEPGRVALLSPRDPSNPNAERARANLERLAAARDARGRSFEVIGVDGVSYVDWDGGALAVSLMNLYLCNGGAIVPVSGPVPGTEQDEAALEALRKTFPVREMVPVSGATISFGGGGPHCITQQIPDGSFAA